MDIPLSSRDRHAGMLGAGPEVDRRHAVVGAVDAEDLVDDAELEQTGSVGHDDRHSGERHRASMAENLRGVSFLPLVAGKTGSKLTAMTEFIAATFLVFMTAGLAVLLERNHRRTADLPRAPFGADLESDIDLARVRHDCARDVPSGLDARPARHTRTVRGPHDPDVRPGSRRQPGDGHGQDARSVLWRQFDDVSARQ